MIHPTADIITNNVGENTKIWQYTIVLAGAKIGHNCNINCHVFVENQVIIGNNVTVKSGVQLWDGITIEDNVFIGPNVTFVNDKRPRANKSFELQQISIKKNASIGAASTIIGGISIGEYAMVGAGSLITKNLKSYSLYVGRPAKFISYICQCGEKLNENLICNSCKKKYTKDQGEIIFCG